MFLGECLCFVYVFPAWCWVSWSLLGFGIFVFSVWLELLLGFFNKLFLVPGVAGFIRPNGSVGELI